MTLVLSMDNYQAAALMWESRKSNALLERRTKAIAGKSLKREGDSPRLTQHDGWSDNCPKPHDPA